MYSARFLVEELHKRNNYKHVVLVTKSSSYKNADNVVSGIARLQQVIWWDTLENKKQKQAVKPN